VDVLIPGVDVLIWNERFTRLCLAGA
jgi:hypothetical protein